MMSDRGSLALGHSCYIHYGEHHFSATIYSPALPSLGRPFRIFPPTIQSINHPNSLTSSVPRIGAGAGADHSYGPTANPVPVRTLFPWQLI